MYYINSLFHISLIGRYIYIYFAVVFYILCVVFVLYWVIFVWFTFALSYIVLYLGLYFALDVTVCFPIYWMRSYSCFLFLIFCLNSLCNIFIFIVHIFVLLLYITLFNVTLLIVFVRRIDSCCCVVFVCVDMSSVILCYMVLVSL